MGNATSAAYTKEAEVTYGSPRFRSLYHGQYPSYGAPVSIFSYTTDASISPVVPEITKYVTNRVQASRQLMGMVSILSSEVTTTGIDLIVPQVTPLTSFSGSNDEILIGLFIIGRNLHRLHTSHNLSHNALSLSSVFVNTDSGDWQLTEELCGDIRQPDFLRLLKSSNSLLDSNFIPPEFTTSQGGRIDFSRYPIHARDAFAFSVFMEHFIAQCRLPVSSITRSTLSKMSSSDYTQRPALSVITEDAMFSSIEAIPFIARLMDLRQGLLPEHEAKELFNALPSLLKRTSNKKVTRIVLEYINKFSIVVHPAAVSTKFLPKLWTMHISKPQDVPAITRSAKAPPRGILSASEYRNIMLPFIGELWLQDRPGLSVILLRTIGRYVYRMDPAFIRDYIVKKMLSLNILLDSQLTNAFISALPIVMKALLKKNFDVAPLVRHIVQSAQLLAANDTLRLRALTCLLAHPKIPIILLKEYLARGLTDTSPHIRLEVIKAAKKFAIEFADNSGPMSARCLADAIIGSLVLSMVDVDSVVRSKARAAIRKLTYVMERKEDQLKAALQQLPRASSAATKSFTHMTLPKPAQSTPKGPPVTTTNGFDSNNGMLRSPSVRSAESSSSNDRFEQTAPFSPGSEPSWGAWDEWEDDDDGNDGNDISSPSTSNGDSAAYHHDDTFSELPLHQTSTPLRASEKEAKSPSRFQLAEDIEADFEPGPISPTKPDFKMSVAAPAEDEDTLDDNWGLESEDIPISSSSPASVTPSQPELPFSNSDISQTPVTPEPTPSSAATPSKLAIASTEDWEESGWGEDDEANF